MTICRKYLLGCLDFALDYAGKPKLFSLNFPIKVLSFAARSYFRFFSFPLSRKALFIGVIPLFEIPIRYYKIKSVIK